MDRNDKEAAVQLDKKSGRREFLIIAVTTLIAMACLAVGDFVLLHAIGIPGLIIGELAAAVVIVLSLIFFPVGEKLTAAEFAPPTLKEILGTAFAYSGALLIGVCSLMIFEFAAPSLSVTGLHIMDYLPVNKLWIAGIFVAVAALSETAMYDIFVHDKLEMITRGKYRMAISIGAAFIYALCHFQPYTFVMLFIIEYSIIIIGDSAPSHILSFVLHLITEIINLAVLQAAGGQIALMGQDLGIKGVASFTLIALAPALLSLTAGRAILSGFKGEKWRLILILSAALVCFAAGFGIKAL